MEIYELPITQANICLAIAALDVWIKVNRKYIRRNIEQSTFSCTCMVGQYAAQERWHYSRIMDVDILFLFFFFFHFHCCCFMLFPSCHPHHFYSSVLGSPIISSSNERMCGGFCSLSECCRCHRRILRKWKDDWKKRKTNKKKQKEEEAVNLDQVLFRLTFVAFPCRLFAWALLLSYSILLLPQIKKMGFLFILLSGKSFGLLFLVFPFLFLLLFVCSAWAPMYERNST